MISKCNSNKIKPKEDFFKQVEDLTNTYIHLINIHYDISAHSTCITYTYIRKHVMSCEILKPGSRALKMFNKKLEKKKTF